MVVVVGLPLLILLLSLESIVVAENGEAWPPVGVPIIIDLD